VNGDEQGHTDEARETFTVSQIREAFAKHSGRDDWGVPSFYESGLIAALRGEYDDDPIAEVSS
jgi:hypothetical protein